MEIVLSKRLETIASYMPKGVKFADIGSDHAYIPCAICKIDPTSSAIAGEVREGPFKSAKKTVKAHQLNEQVDVRLGDGLDVIDNEVTHIIIAGMGGALIESILDRGKDKIGAVEQMILQPNVGAKNVRRWLYNNKFRLVKEQMVEENSHIYEVLIATKEQENELHITEKEIFLGPIFLQEKSNLFIKKWRRERSHLERIIEQIMQSKIPDVEQIDQFRQQLTWIEEELNNES